MGNIPLIKFNSSVEKKANNVYFKMEGNNPTGSVKDRTACALILEKIKSRELVKGKTILDASSGSFACSMAYFGKILGFPVITICGSKLTEDKRSFISYFDAEWYMHGDIIYEGNIYCREKLIKESPKKYCFLDQLHNWENPNITL